jgi:hypothetical protein
MACVLNHARSIEAFVGPKMGPVDLEVKFDTAKLKYADNAEQAQIESHPLVAMKQGHNTWILSYLPHPAGPAGPCLRVATPPEYPY